MPSAQGDLTAALAAYRASWENSARLAAADPGNAGWQRDLWVSYSRMAAMTEQTGSGDARPTCSPRSTSISTRSTRPPRPRPALPARCARRNHYTGKTRVRSIARISPRLQQGFGIIVIAFAIASYFQYDTQIVAWLTSFYPTGQIGL